MAERSYNGRELLGDSNSDFENSPGGVATTSTNRWVDGTAGGAATNAGKYNIHFVEGGAASAVFDNVESYSGNSSLKISTLATGSYVEARLLAVGYETFPGEGVTLRPNTTYTMGYWMKTNYVSGDATNGARCVFLEANATGTNIGGGGAGTYVKTTTDWKYYTVTFTTKANAVRGHFEFRIYGHQGTATLIMDAWFDDISLTEVLPARLPISVPRTPATNRVAVRDMGTALRFDGVDDVVTASAFLNDSTTTDPFTLSMWFNSSTSLYTSSDQNRFLTSRYGTISFRERNVRVAVNSANIVSVPFLPQLWYLIVGTFDGTTLRLYRNGVAVGTPITPTISSTYGSNSGQIGANTGNSRYFNGIIDEPRIWNRALTAQEIANLYFNNIVPRNGLVAEYLFNEATGTTAFDSSGNGNHGTITGATYTLDTPLKPRINV